MTATALEKLQTFLEELRDPKIGCAWTRAQTFETLAIHSLEEIYELVEAIEQQDIHLIKDELSDLLYHLVFYVQIAAENNWFTLDDVANAILEKHQQRLPDPNARQQFDAEEVNTHWEQAKTQARKEQQQTSVLDAIAITLPALTRALKLQKRAASVGFDWPEIPPVIDKLHEELSELQVEIDAKTDKTRLTDELGDVIFSCVNLARHLDIDPDAALRHANRKFTTRFQKLEQLANENKLDLTTMSLAELEALWQAVK